MKKVLAIVLAALLIVAALVGCAAKSETADTTATTDTAAAETTDGKLEVLKVGASSLQFTTTKSPAAVPATSRNASSTTQNRTHSTGVACTTDENTRLNARAPSTAYSSTEPWLSPTAASQPAAPSASASTAMKR